MINNRSQPLYNIGDKVQFAPGVERSYSFKDEQCKDFEFKIVKRRRHREGFMEYGVRYIINPDNRQYISNFYSSKNFMIAEHHLKKVYSLDDAIKSLEKLEKNFNNEI